MKRILTAVGSALLAALLLIFVKKDVYKRQTQPGSAEERAMSLWIFP